MTTSDKPRPFIFDNIVIYANIKITNNYSEPFPKIHPNKMILKWVVFCTIIIGCSAYYRPVGPRRLGAVSTARDLDTDRDDYLLPDFVKPTHYTLNLFTHIENFNESDPTSFGFEGTVEITIEYTGDTEDNLEKNKITLHAHPTITVTNATIVEIVEEEPPDPVTPRTLTPGTIGNETNHLNLTLSEGVLTNGTYLLTIEYSGVHGDDMHGFYRSYYEDENGKKIWLVTTQFESYDARRAFPCFDEPRFKAKYEITISVAKDLVDNWNYTALSNSPAVDSDPNADPNADPVVFKFKPTPRKISSYLIAFIVSDFTSSAPATFNSTYGEDEVGLKKFRTWGRKVFIEDNQATISQLAGPAALEVMTDLTQVGFGMPKLDQVGIPDFSAGAMENWGLTTYRERYIFFNEKTDPLSTKQSVVTVTVHELAHQWFGDLVTLHWWSDIWLNEGFATFFEYHATDKIQTKDLNTSTWNIIGQFVNEELQAGAFETDGQETSRALTTEVYAPGDIDANFDNIAYSKGGSVLRMWYHILGEDIFYTALNSYLIANAEDNGTPESLLQHFDWAIQQHNSNPLLGKNVTDVFSDWHMQAGYPVVNVTVSNNTVTVTQERFLYSEPSTLQDKRWSIPITYSTDKELNFDKLNPVAFFDKEKDNFTWPLGADGAEWVILNNQQTGYYRVNYDPKVWNNIGVYLSENREKVPEITRAQLIDDVFSLARSTQHKYVTYDLAFWVSSFLSNETNLIPWRAAFNSYNYLYTKLASDNETRTLITRKILETVTPIYDKLTLNVKPTDSHTDRLLRIQVASWACKLGYQKCVDDANSLFGEGITIGGDNKVDPDVLSTVVCSVVRQADTEDKWNEVWGYYEKAKGNNVVETLLLSALGCTKNATLAQEYLEKTLITTDAPIRKQDLTAVFSAVYNGNPENVAVTLDFLEKNLENIANTFGGLDPLGGLLRGVANLLSTDKELERMKNLEKTINASDNLLVQAGRTGASQAVGIVQSNKAWVEQKKEDIVSALTEEEVSAMSTLTVSLSLTFFAIILSLLSC